MKIGYARVSTIDQNLDRQSQALMQYACDLIFQEKISGKNTHRPEFQKMMEQIKEGDVIVVSELSRLGRSLRDLLNIISDLQKKKVGFISLKESMNTNSPHGMLIFTIMGALAEYERTQILERQRDGIKAAKRNGKHLGRPFKITRAAELISDHEAGMSEEDMARKYKVSTMTIYRNLKKIKEETGIITPQTDHIPE